MSLANRSLALVSLGTLLPIFSGCARLTGDASPILEGDGFFDRPFPSEARMVDGSPDLSDFPGQDDYDLLGQWAAEAHRMDGFGTTSPIYLRFDRILGSDDLPDPLASMSTDAPAFLVDIDPASPDRGKLHPFTWDFQVDETEWQPEHLLAVQPVWGRPLRPGTRYAFVLTTDRYKPVPDFAEVWTLASSEHARHRDLQETLFRLHVDLDRVAYAVQFTTQDPTREAAAMARQVHDGLPLPALDQELSEVQSNRFYDAYEGVLVVPRWQQGVAPYLLEGGAIEFDEDGEALLAGWDKVAFVLSIPTDGDMPEGGWPVVIFGHGTGDSAWGFADEANAKEPASVFAQRGMAGIGISLPFHGDRYISGDEALLSFNYANPESGRATFRQAAMEQVYLARLLSSQQHRFTAGRTALALDPDRVAYMGHSHGGEIGAIALPFFRDTLRAAVISGTGGGLSLAIVHRDAGDYGIQDLLRSGFGFDDDEVLDETHPLTGFIQLLGEATDPINYAPFWHRWTPAFEAKPAHVLMFEGLKDVHTPPVATEALAGAAAHPILNPVEQYSLVQDLADLMGEPTPAIDNLVAWDQSRVTGGLAQYADQDHFAVYNDKDAIELYGDFLSSAMDGRPEIIAR